MPFVMRIFHHDHLGSTRMITDLSGNIESVQETLAYGEDVTEPLQTEEGTILNNIGFTGHEHDYGTGFINMQARLQDPREGKFNVPDPGHDYDQMDPMSFNLYSYVRCNPIKYLDPKGTKIDYSRIKNKRERALVKKIVERLKKKGPKDIKKMLKKLESSKNTHYIQLIVQDPEAPSVESHDGDYNGTINDEDNQKLLSGKSVGSITYIEERRLFQFDEKEEESGYSQTFESVLVHELRHGFDKDMGISTSPQSKNYVHTYYIELEAVKMENKMLKYQGFSQEREGYGWGYRKPKEWYYKYKERGDLSLPVNWKLRNE